eukprot:tig00020563_g11317.t1
MRARKGSTAALPAAPPPGFGLGLSGRAGRRPPDPMPSRAERRWQTRRRRRWRRPVRISSLLRAAARPRAWRQRREARGGAGPGGREAPERGPLGFVLRSPALVTAASSALFSACGERRISVGRAGKRPGEHPGQAHPLLQRRPLIQCGPASFKKEREASFKAPCCT